MYVDGIALDELDRHALYAFGHVSCDSVGTIKRDLAGHGEAWVYINLTDRLFSSLTRHDTVARYKRPSKAESEGHASLYVSYLAGFLQDKRQSYAKNRRSCISTLLRRSSHRSEVTSLDLIVVRLGEYSSQRRADRRFSSPTCPHLITLRSCLWGRDHEHAGQ